VKTIQTIDGPVRVPEGPMDLTGPQWMTPRGPASDDDRARARRDEVAAVAPGAAAAWSLIELLGVRAQPVLFSEGERCGLWRGPVFPDSAAAIEYFARWRQHGVGIASGDQGGWGLLAVWCRDSSAWRRWIFEHGTVQMRNPAESRELTRRELRDLGQPAVIHWRPDETGPPYTQPKIYPTTVDAAVDQQARLAVLESVTHPTETWVVYPYRGQATWKARELAVGLWLRGPNEPIPVESSLAGYCLATAGSLQRPETSSASWLPSWLANAMKVKGIQ
jgi:hypothetical protein